METTIFTTCISCVVPTLATLIRPHTFLNHLWLPKGLFLALFFCASPLKFHRSFYRSHFIRLVLFGVCWQHKISKNDRNLQSSIGQSIVSIMFNYTQQNIKQMAFIIYLLQRMFFIHASYSFYDWVFVGV